MSDAGVEELNAKKDSIVNLALLPKKDNISKKDKVLKEGVKVSTKAEKTSKTNVDVKTRRRDYLHLSQK